MAEKKKKRGGRWWAEQRKAYVAKNDLLWQHQADWEPITPREFYRAIFPQGFLETKGVMIDSKEPGGGKPNAICIQITNSTWKSKTESGKEREIRVVDRYTVTDDLDMVEERITDSMAKDEAVFMAPVTYFGKKRIAKNARYLHAFAIDLDGVGVQQLSNILKQIRNGYDPEQPKWTSLPQPTFLVNSGTGFHLYYVLDEPVPLPPKNVPFLQEMKQKLTEYVWRDTTSALEERQYQGIYQAFRMPGTPTKLNGKKPGSKRSAKYEAVAWCHYVGEGAGRKPFTCDLRYLMGYAGMKNGGKDAEELIRLSAPPARTPIDQAKELWPEWYEQRILGQKPAGGWECKRDLYDWWLRQIEGKATDHHRYWCLNALAAYAVKCGVSYDELEEDALSLVPRLESLTEREDNHFTEEDALAAIASYNDGVCRKLSVERIERRTAIEMPRNKRNGRKQELHLKMARSNLSILNEDAGRALQGRKPKRDEILAFAAEHPGMSHSAIAKTLGVSRTTVIKWLKGDALEKYIAGRQADESGQASAEGGLLSMLLTLAAVCFVYLPLYSIT